MLKIGQCQCAKARDDRTRVPNIILIRASLVNEHPEHRLEGWRLGRGRLIAHQGFLVWQQT